MPAPPTSTELHEAIRTGRVNRVRQLLEQGVSPDSVDQYGFSALARAAEEGKHHIVRVLLEHRATVEAGLRDDTPLWFAVTANFRRKNLAYATSAQAQERLPDDDVLATVDALLRAGADVNAAANTKRHPPLITMAAIWCPLAVIKRLVEAGADPTSGDALGWARREKRHDVAAYLETFSPGYEQRRLQLEQEDRERRRQSEERDAQAERDAAKEKRKHAVKEGRRAKGQCVMCGAPLGILDRLRARDAHASCRTFRE